MIGIPNEHPDTWHLAQFGAAQLGCATHPQGLNQATPNKLPPRPTKPAPSYKDTTKAPLEELLAVPDALEAIARLFRLAHDTKGYGFKAFETLDPSELRDALMRHTFQTGIKHMEVDDQSKMLHAIHAAANGLMYVQNLINRSEAN